MPRFLCLLLSALAFAACASAPEADPESAWTDGIVRGPLWWTPFTDLGPDEAAAVLAGAERDEQEYLADLPDGYRASPFECCFEYLDEGRFAEREVAFATLLNRRSVTERRDPDEGLPSYDLLAVETLAAQPDARAAFAALADRATTAGRLYALVGLRDLDPARFASLAAELAASDADVYSYETGTYIAVAEVARAIRDGAAWPGSP